VDRQLRVENLRAGLAVAWNGGDPSYAAVDLFVGHPGRITEESVEPDLCEVGVDVFVDWHLRRSESGTSWQLSDLEPITEAEYSGRVDRMDAGLPPMADLQAAGMTVLSAQPGSTASASGEERTAAVRELLAHILLAREFDGQRDVLVQLGALRVVGGPVTFVELSVDSAAPVSALPDGPLPIPVWVVDEHDHAVGTMVVWLAGGYLSALEYGWMTNEPPAALPRVERVRVELA
jgi:hypothetical protein